MDIEHCYQGRFQHKSHETKWEHKLEIQGCMLYVDISYVEILYVYFMPT